MSGKVCLQASKLLGFQVRSFERSSCGDVARYFGRGEGQPEPPIKMTLTLSKFSC